MVSYNGKIQPRSHDNILSYVGGETKILSVDRSLKFSSLYSKLSSILSSDPGTEPVSAFTFKYQLPGEDLDALISVTNDDDLENMMHEYDRLCRGSNKPARLRVFLFPVLKTSSFGSTSSDKIDRDSDRFVEALNSGLPPPPGQTQVNSNMDFLFGLEKSNVPVPVPVQVQVPVQQRHEPDPQIEARIHELNRMQISAQEMNLNMNMNPNRPKSEDGGTGLGLFPGGGANIPVGYWQQQQPLPPPQQPPQEQPLPPPQQPPQLQPQSQPLPQFQQLHHFQQPSQISQPPQQQHQVYMVHHAPPQGNMYHAPMMRAVTNQQAPPQQGYYRVGGSEQVYREQPVYKYAEGMGGVPGRPVASMESGYHQQVGAYDSGSGRQVYYAAQPGNGGIVTAPFQGVSGEMRTVAPVVTSSPEVNAKVIPK